jgi:GNAT superfamily N-acetyltransferase
MTTRPATLGDADLDAIIHQRRAMFRDMGYRDEQALEAMSAAFRPWLRQKMKAGRYLGWFALAPDDSIAAGLGVWLMDWPPHMVGNGPWRGNIVNVYTEPPWRRRGLARRLMQMALDWCEANGVGVIILHASDEGRALYESFGFAPTNEMRLVRR